MTLYELVNATVVQSECVEIKVFDKERNEIKTECFYNVDELSTEDIDEYEDMEIIYIYSEGYVRYYPNSTKNCACLVIEVEKEED